jgi:hypothetical protein
MVVMLIVLHIAVALAGLVCAALSAVRPTRRRLRATLALTGLTLYSGALLVVQDHASLAGACMSGLTYLVAVGISAAVGYWRLSKSL